METAINSAVVACRSEEKFWKYLTVLYQQVALRYRINTSGYRENVCHHSDGKVRRGVAELMEHFRSAGIHLLLEPFASSDACKQLEQLEQVCVRVNRTELFCHNLIIEAHGKILQQTEEPNKLDAAAVGICEELLHSDDSTLFLAEARFGTSIFSYAQNNSSPFSVTASKIPMSAKAMLKCSRKNIAR